jgi:hypothetical protein
MPKKSAPKSRASKASRAAGSADATPAPNPRLAAIRAAAERLPKPATTTRSYFLLLSRDEPAGRRFVQLRAPSVLAWFQRMWSAGAPWKSDLGGYVYGFGKLFDAIEEHRLARPASDEALRPLLEKHIYFEQKIEVEPHFVHVETDDDEVKVEYYFFDDAFLGTPDALDRLPGPHADADGDSDPYSVLLAARAE